MYDFDYIFDFCFKITFYHLIMEILDILKRNYNKKKLYTLDILPILTPYNKSEFLDWHNYYEKVYKHPVKKNIDLNNFTWFYWNCPIKNIKENINHFNQIYNNIPNSYNVPWIQCFPENVPEVEASKYGFFVTRKTNYKKFYKKYLEVFRVDIKITPETPKLCLEIDTTWYWHTIGSGIFIKNNNKNLLLNDRPDWYYNIKFNEIDKNAIEVLKNDNIDTVIIIDSLKYWNFVPRTEIIKLK